MPQDFTPDPQQPAGPAPVPAAPAVPVAQYGPDGRLTYASFRAAIQSGGSVVYKGRVIAHVGDPNMPTELDYAGAAGDAAAVERVRAGKEAEIGRLRAELDAPNAPKPPAPATPAATASAAAADAAADQSDADADGKARAAGRRGK